MAFATSASFRSTALRVLGGAVLTLLAITAGAETEIHRCAQPDGTVAFQETPCPESEPVADGVGTDSNAGNDSPADEFFDFANPYDEPAERPEPTGLETETPMTQNRADCEQETRDAIDAIDLELQQDVAVDQRERYLARLLELTRQLRACKSL